jgi:ElaB/YqjD/DUF883 family membrane-anchored ribosome-binding protein
VDNELEVIRNEMEETRSSLADKLEALESEFRGTVEGATSAVANTVEAVQETVSNVKETVQETVESVKETLDVRKHVERHPWAMFGGAFALGCVAGFLLGPRRRSRSPAEAAPPAPPTPIPTRNGAGHRNGAAQKTSSRTEEPGVVESTLQELRGLAVGTLMSVLREVLTGAVPSSLAPDLAGVVDDLTTKLGGKPLRRSEDADQQDAATQGVTPHDESDSTEMDRPLGAARWSR